MKMMKGVQAITGIVPAAFTNGILNIRLFVLFSPEKKDDLARVYNIYNQGDQIWSSWSA